MTATDWRGQPVRGAFSVGVVDASLYAIQKEYARTSGSIFYGDRRSQLIQNCASTDMRWQIHMKDGHPGQATTSTSGSSRRYGPTSRSGRAEE